MVQLRLNDEEATILSEVLENYTVQLDVEIHRTDRLEFKQLLEKRERVLHEMVGRLAQERKSA